MKATAIAFLALCCATTSLAAPLAIFGRHDSRPVDAATAPNDSGQAAFFHDYAGDRSGDAPYEAELPFANPPAWGKTISNQAGGVVRYHRLFTHGFVCRVEFHGLLAGHTYLLTLNGNPEKAGNDLLPTPVPGNEREKYYDFLDITTDAGGRYAGDLGIFLKRGAYDVRFYVKDTSDFKIVLYRDFFPFRVE